MAIFPGRTGDDITAIDGELAKLAAGLRAAWQEFNFGRVLLYTADVDDLLDRRLALRSASV